ncbi:probable polygalacturonase At3g15720 [Spinacia oleracea]|uniref:Probable polygalacturonase At3g15720 n=1 Tax=Spinacia oleracea TaxID=3562 RepID=A0ABM3R9H5_SPIOL|nr:probable polygalacturonase At3g15720 [Spinacia oleracea]
MGTLTLGPNIVLGHIEFFVLIVVYVLLSVSQLIFCIRTPNGSILTSSSQFNVMNYGAIGDGLQDDTPAFSKAWADVCGAIGEIPTLTIPAGKTFLLTPISFHGPCKSSNIHVEIQGKLVAPDNRGSWKNCEANCWIVFSSVENLIVDGSGKINGTGSIWWQNNDPTTRDNALCLINCNGLRLQGLTHVDSPKSHISISGCNNSIISNLQIMAPETSHNTDGIDIISSNRVHISDSIIQTGDDCIAIGSHTSWLNITGITCGPGHGISVGSLGKEGEDAKVEEIYVKNCTFKGSLNGARIKTWQGGLGYARNIIFEDIPLIDVGNPIIIDQYYCDGAKNCGTAQSGVKVTGVSYRGFHGTSKTAAAISLNCSSTVACTGIVMESINIVSSTSSYDTYAVCINAQGKQSLVAPQVPCLTH